MSPTPTRPTPGALHLRAPARPVCPRLLPHRCSIVQTVPGPSYIPLEDLILAARALAGGQSLKRVAAALGWDMNRMRRCVTRLDTQVRMEGERQWHVTSQTALEWLRMRRLCTPDELEQAVSMARERVVRNLQNTLDCCARLQSEGDHSRAEVIYLKHLRDDPGNVKLTAALARCLLETGRPEEALARFDFALAREPGDADIRYGRAITLYRMGRQHDAVSELEIAQRREPDSAHIQVWLGLWRMRLNRDRDQNVALVKRAMATLTREYANRDDWAKYCRGSQRRRSLRCGTTGMRTRPWRSPALQKHTAG